MTDGLDPLIGKLKRKRRVVLIEMDLPSNRWSSSELERRLNELAPDLRPVVFGEISGAEVDAAWRKLRQLSRETEEDASQADRIHSAHKALSFWRDVFPGRLWSWWAIGEPQKRRQRLLRKET